MQLVRPNVISENAYPPQRYQAAKGRTMSAVAGKVRDGDELIASTFRRLDLRRDSREATVEQCSRDCVWVGIGPSVDNCELAAKLIE